MVVSLSITQTSFFKQILLFHLLIGRLCPLSVFYSLYLYDSLPFIHHSKYFFLFSSISWLRLDLPLTFDIHTSIHQPIGVLSIYVSVACLASSHTLNPDLRFFHNASTSLSLGLLAAGGCSRTVTGWRSCHSLCMCLVLRVRIR